MSHQESANVRMVGVKVSQELFRRIERAAKHTGSRDVSEFVRRLFEDAVRDVELTEEDRVLIQNRIDSRRNQLARGRH